MNAIQAQTIGRLAKRQASDTDVETRMVGGGDQSYCEVKFQDHMLMDTYRIDSNGIVIEEHLGRRV